jgi:exodeoxyribonuclease VII large subunit
LRSAGPHERIPAAIRDIERFCGRLESAVAATLNPARARLRSSAAVLEALSPAAVLDRGFAAISLPGESQAVHSITQARSGVRARARVADGEIDITLGESRAVPILRTIT